MAGELTAARTSVAIVPARYASSRFPGKPLADIAGVPMILRVLRGIADSVDSVFVATDDKHIAKVAEDDGFGYVMTGPASSGTERVHMAWEFLGCPGDVIINVQGDEPMVQRSWIDPLVSGHDGSSQVLTLARRVDPSEARSEDRVKVAATEDGRVLYFSRSPIPLGAGSMLEHVGIYSFTPGSLRICARCGSTRLSRTERLEQLAWMEHGVTLRVVTGEFEGTGVDTPADLERAVEYFRS